MDNRKVGRVVDFAQPCPPHDWAHAPTVGYFECVKCRERVDYKDPRYGVLLKRQSGAEGRRPMTSNPVKEEAVTLLPCRECGAPCRVETFGGGVHCTPTDLWTCSNASIYGGSCPSQQHYLSADAWNVRDGKAMRQADPRIAELEAAMKAVKLLIGEHGQNDTLHEATRQSNRNRAWHIFDAVLNRKEG